MENEIDSVIAEANEQIATETPVDEPLKVEEPKPEDDSQKAESDDDSVTFPKKAINALSRRDKTIGKLRAELAALKAAQVAQPTPQAQQIPQNIKSDGAPREEDFDNYGDYLKASFKYDLQQEQAKTKAEAQSQQETYKEQLWKAEREQAIIQSFDGHKQALPDFEQVVASFVDVADEFSPEIENIFYSADDPALAFYNLAKEGKLEALATMSPYQVMREVALAEMKKPQVNRVTNAPNPIKPVQGRGSVSKDVGSMSGEELLKKYNIKY